MDEKIKETIRIAQAIEADIIESKSIDIQKAYAENNKRITSVYRKQWWKTFLLRAAAVLILPLLISTLILGYLYQKKETLTDKVSFQEISAAPGTVVQVLLPDSSRVWLNAGSSLRYPSRFTSKARIVQLTGEGYFDVQSDKKYPFFVSLSNDIRVKVYGTRFNISDYEDDTQTEITLETGHVDVLYGTSRTMTLKPEEEVVFSKKENRFMQRKVNVDEKIAWKEGRMVFRNATLEDICRQLSRRYNVEIVLHKETTKEYKFRAVFSSENITQILDYFRMVAPIRWQFSNVKQEQDYSFTHQKIDVWIK